MIKLLSGKLNETIADFNAIDRHKMRSEKTPPLFLQYISNTANEIYHSCSLEVVD